MHEIDGTAMRDIAEALSVPLFTLYSRLKSARLTFAKEVRRRQLVLHRPANPQVVLDEERVPSPAPAPVRRRLLARLRAFTPPADFAPVPPRRWPLAVAAGVLIAAALSGAALPVRSGPAPGLVGHWTFDDGPGSALARDSSGRGNDCFLRRLDPQQAWRPGALADGLGFAGNGWLECPRSSALDGLTSELTIAAWVTRGQTVP